MIARQAFYRPQVAGRRKKSSSIVDASAALEAPHGSSDIFTGRLYRGAQRVT
jgi:hypothetical protein